MCLAETHIWRFFNQLFAECHNQLKICYTPQAEADLAEAIVISEHYKDLADNIHPLFAELMGTYLSVQQQPESRETLLLAADNYIQHHFFEPINTQTLAVCFSISPAYFGEIFREYKSVSPIEYIMTLRIEHAKKLFLTDKHVSVKSVAELVGYDDPFYFSKVFKRMTGKSPKDFLEDGGKE